LLIVLNLTSFQELAKKVISTWRVPWAARVTRGGPLGPGAMWSYYTAKRWWPCLGVGLPDLRIHLVPGRLW